MKGTTAGLRPSPDFRAIFETAPSLLLVFSPDLRILAASDAYLRATMTRREDIVGRDVFEVFPENPDDPGTAGENKARSSFERVIRTRAPDTPGVIKYDIRRPEAEGGGYEERFWSPVNVPLLDGRGELAAIIHRVEDVTDFVRLQRLEAEERRITTELQQRASSMESEVFQRAAELQEANRRLREANETLRRNEGELGRLSKRLSEANRELEAFSYSVSHDLRAPLRHIHGFADMLRRHSGESLDDRGRELLEVISDAARGMGRLIEDLLSFSRMARAELRWSSVPLEPLVAGVIAELRPDLENRTVDWRVGRLPVIPGDPAMLRIVLQNLLANAVKYTRPREQARIEVECEELGGEFVVVVRDNGVGFDMRYVDKLFGVFQRLHRADEFEGTGIGLANVRRIVQRHGGRVWAEAEPGAGATFRFTVPGVDPGVEEHAQGKVA